MVPVLDWVVLVDLRDDVMAEDLQFRFASLEEAQRAVVEWIREGHVARVSVVGGKEVYEVFPLVGVKRFETRFQPLPTRPA